MAFDRVQYTSLWKDSLSIRENDLHSEQREELRASLIKFRSNTEKLVTKISQDLPNLTLHDISHLDALWEIANLIAGEGFPLTPLEGFVLGGAILLHDSALCFEAYNNGLNGLRSTITWKDAYSSLVESPSKSENIEEMKSEADFIALRYLHAEQASKLLERSWADPDTGQEIYLLENVSLRKHLGQLIGQIASSHHWSIEKVGQVFSTQVNSPSPYPREWRIDPMKIACLLRCADAAHIDSERAPDFLYALLKRKGISFNHWQAQNRLARADVDQYEDNLSTLVFTSTRSFRENESESWWVAYDAINIVDKEIKASNALLESQNGRTKSFEIKRVKGVESPEIMAKYIKVEGWRPYSAAVHVSNIESLVKNLGGDKLYGTDRDLLEISIRELIQNARDSIVARRYIEQGFIGKINVKINFDEDNLWMIVEDDGVGMSERVLTGPLLDFGNSFWTSSLVQSEFPGLRASKYKSIGRYGIGFYSVFMIADKVAVTTKPWREGLADSIQLRFDNGISLRPLMKKGPFTDFSSYTSTQIKLLLKQDALTNTLEVVARRNIMGETNLKISFEDYLSAICAGLDTSVYLSIDGSAEKKIHENIETEELDKESWLKKISFIQYQNADHLSQYISDNVTRLRYIKDQDKIFGLAAISTFHGSGQNFLSTITVGGLATTVHMRDASVKSIT